MCPRDVLPELGVMDEATFTALLAELAKSPALQWISLCGIGEPLLHPRLRDWVARLVALPTRPSVGLVTAGQRLTLDTFAALEAAGIALVEVSVQAVDPDRYAQLMPGLNLAKVLANLEAIAAWAPRRVPVSIGITRHALNNDDIPQIQALATRLGFRTSLTELHTRAGHVRDDRLVLTRRAPSTGVACRIFEKVTFVGWDGRIHYCCHDVARQHVVGQLPADSLATINARKQAAIVSAGGPTAAICARCDDPLRETL